MRPHKKLPLPWQLPLAVGSLIGFFVGLWMAGPNGGNSPAPSVGIILGAFTAFVILQTCERFR